MTTVRGFGTATASPVTLNAITPGSIARGGYVIGYTGNVPLGTRLLLAVPDVRHSLDVTGRPKNDLLSAQNLPAFLACIGKQGLWGREAECRLLVMRGMAVVAESAGRKFRCPVQPLKGPLSPALGEADGGPKLQYTGVQNGRMLYQPAIDGCYYFAYGGKFETDNLHRGLNCITYAGAVFGVDPASHAMSAYGTQLANHLGALACGLENASEVEIKAFFAVNPRGTYLMWSATHTVVIVNAVVHEFSQGKHGYVKTPVAQWHFHGARYWVRKTPKQL